MEQQTFVMDDEIDLRPYLRAIGRNWRWIGLTALLLAAVAIGWSLTQPRTYSATVPVLVNSTRSQIAFDPRFVTDEAQQSDVASRSKALLALATSNVIEAGIPADTLRQVTTAPYQIGDLALHNIEASADGDLLLIVATADTPDQAKLLADAWATSYVTQVNALYGNLDLPLDYKPQVTDAEQQYTAAQQAYEQFLATSPINELGTRMTDVTGVISATQKANQLAYAGYLSKVQALDLVWRDAEALRSQLAGSNTISFSDNLAVLTLQSRASDASELPVQLQFDQGAALNDDRATVLAKLDDLIASLRQQITDTQTAADQLSSNVTAPADGSSATQAAQFAQLQDVQSRLEAERGKARALQLERDVAYETLQILRRKQLEQRVAATSPDAEVRLAGSALLPSSPDSRGTVINAVLGGFVGLLLSIGVVVVLTIRQTLADQSQPQPVKEVSPAT